MARLSKRPETFFRLSPAIEGKARCFAVRRGETSGRLDPNFIFNKPDFSRQRYAILPLASVREDVFQGVTIKPGDSEDPIVLKVKNIRGDEGFDFSNVEHARDVPERKKLRPGDLISPFIGEAIRQINFAIFNVTEGQYTVDGNTGVIRPNRVKVSPEYLQNWFQSSFGSQQILRLIGGGGVPFLGAHNVAKLVVAVPPDTKTQDRLTAAMDAARETRRAKLAEADALLAGLDGFLLATLGLTPLPEDDRKVFAVHLGEVERKQIGANLYAPALRVYLRALSSGSFSTRKLRDEVAVNPTVSFEGITETSLVSFVPMEAVEDKASGGVRLQDRKLSEVKKGYTPFAEGDVLWAKITPCMENGKSCVARGLTNKVGFGSTELHVLRPLSERVTAEYIHEFISQSALRSVARFAFTGSAGHQRVPAEFLEQLPFPVPSLSIQEQIATEARRCRKEACRLRTEAEAGWQAAKHWFENELLTPVNP